MEPRIMTLHPEGKEGVNISKEKYELIRQAIVGSLEDSGELTFSELGSEVARRLEGKFQGSISWYYTTVKLDLEARNVIERIAKRSPQRIRLVAQRP
jgi:hypothetical protein